MNTAEHTRARRTMIQADHRRLEQLVGKVLQLLRDRPDAPSFDSRLAQLSKELSNLRQHLFGHFQREESGGLLEEVAANVPRLAPEVDVIEREHPALLAELDQLIAQVAVEKDTAAGWDSYRNGFRNFAKTLCQHEARENRLLQEGLNDDLELDA